MGFAGGGVGFSSGSASGTTSPSTGTDLLLGTPSDGTFTDGLLPLESSATIANTIDAINEALQNISAAGSGASVISITADSSTAVGDLVYIDGNGIAQRAIATSAVTSRVVGFILTKPDSTTARITQYGLSNRSGLITGLKYYLSANSPGQVQVNAPTAAGTIIKQIGVAVSTSTILFNINKTPVTVRS